VIVDVVSQLAQAIAKKKFLEKSGKIPLAKFWEIS
jgi:hypothetical protein